MVKKVAASLLHPPLEGESHLLFFPCCQLLFCLFVAAAKAHVGDIRHDMLGGNACLKAHACDVYARKGMLEDTGLLQLLD